MDPVDGDRFVRLSFAASSEVVAEAVERIIAFQEGHRPVARPPGGTALR
jgi:aspartate/methionine/tyrosine aminotransferase